MAIRELGNLLTRKTESSQSINRVLVVSIYSLFMILGNIPYAIGSLWVIGGLTLWAFWTHLTREFISRKLASIAIDQGLVTTAIFFAGMEFSPALFVLYVWVILGNGYRFGSIYALIAYLFALVGVVGLSQIEEFSITAIVTVHTIFSLSLVTFFIHQVLNNLNTATQNAVFMERKAQAAIDKSKRDPLTGLCNREAVIETLQKAREENTKLGTIFVDLDNFKKFNDEFGHHVGDEVLINISQRLQRCIRSHNDVVCRYAGDEFVILIDGGDHLKLERVTDRVVKILSSPLIVDGINDPLIVTGSVGVATFGNGTNADNILQAADAAMYRAKQQGKNQVAWHKET